jgi:hypothetical protein
MDTVQLANDISSGAITITNDEAAELASIIKANDSLETIHRSLLILSAKISFNFYGRDAYTDAHRLIKVAQLTECVNWIYLYLIARIDKKDVPKNFLWIFIYSFKLANTQLGLNMDISKLGRAFLSEYETILSMAPVAPKITIAHFDLCFYRKDIESLATPFLPIPSYMKLSTGNLNVILSSLMQRRLFSDRAFRLAILLVMNVIVKCDTVLNSGNELVLVALCFAYYCTHQSYDLRTALACIPTERFNAKWNLIRSCTYLLPVDSLRKLSAEELITGARYKTKACGK